MTYKVSIKILIMNDSIKGHIIELNYRADILRYLEISSASNFIAPSNKLSGLICPITDIKRSLMRLLTRSTGTGSSKSYIVDFEDCKNKFTPVHCTHCVNKDIFLDI